MALDHYIPQVYLREFCLRDTGRLLAMRKSTGETFEPSPRNVCAIHDGNTNAFLRDDRAIEDFLSKIEPNFGAALQNLEAAKFDNQTIFTLAGLVSAIYSCSPTSMRMNLPQVEELVDTSARLMDKHGLFDEKPMPKQIGADSLTEALETGKINIKVDPKFPQAVTIAGVLDLTRVFGNSNWEILVNSENGNPFLTSDFPVGLEHMGLVNAKLVPLTPSMAVRIIPNIEARDPSDEFDMRFRGFRWRKTRINRKTAAAINRTIVQCAEDLVFCSERLDWFERFVARNSAYQLTTAVDRIPSPDGNGSYLVATQKIVKRSI